MPALSKLAESVPFPQGCAAALVAKMAGHIVHG